VEKKVMIDTTGKGFVSSARYWGRRTWILDEGEYLLLQGMNPLTQEGLRDIVVANLDFSPIGRINAERHKELDYSTVRIREDMNRRWLNGTATAIWAAIAGLPRAERKASSMVWSGENCIGLKSRRKQHCGT
jgi:hypothetical protein